MATSDIQNSTKYNDIVSQIQNAKQNANSTSEASTTDKSAMGKDDFLKLLVTSLTYQDPMSPMETGDMMQQMAMLGLMEQTTNMRTALDQLAKSNELSKWQEGSNMLGKIVDAYNTEGKEITGVVKEIFNYDGSLYFITDQDTFEVGNIISLKDVTASNNAGSETSDKQDIAKAIEQIEESKSKETESTTSTSPTDSTSTTAPIVPPTQTTDNSTNQKSAQDEYTIGDLNQLLA